MSEARGKKGLADASIARWTAKGIKYPGKSKRGQPPPGELLKQSAQFDGRYLG